MSSKHFFLALIYIALGIFLSVLQVSFFPRLGFADISPDLHYILIISLPFTFPVWLGTIIVILLGVITDTFMLTSSGLHIIGFLCFYYILVYMQQTVYFDHLLFKAFMAGMAYFILFLVQQFFLTAHGSMMAAHFHLIPGLGTALATTVFAIPLLYLLQTLNKGMNIT